MSVTPHEIISDDNTVWINGYSGACIGRFGKGGIDIHREAHEQITKGECIHCTHTRPQPADWLEFVKGMLTHHNVTVEESHKPKWLFA